LSQPYLEVLNLRHGKNQKLAAYAIRSLAFL
jgi:hypothetical protein